MSSYDVEYCPWCGSKAEHEIRRFNSVMARGNVCTECDTFFRVQVAHTETKLKWTSA